MSCYAVVEYDAERQRERIMGRFPDMGDAVKYAGAVMRGEVCVEEAYYNRNLYYNIQHIEGEESD